MRPHSPPASAAQRSAAGTASGAGNASARPATAAASAPQINCPSAPMLKRPTVKATATDKPVSTSTLPLSALSPSGRAPPTAPSSRLA